MTAPSNGAGSMIVCSRSAEAICSARCSDQNMPANVIKPTSNASHAIRTGAVLAASCLRDRRYENHQNAPVIIAAQAKTKTSPSVAGRARKMNGGAPHSARYATRLSRFSKISGIVDIASEAVVAMSAATTRYPNPAIGSSVEENGRAKCPDANHASTMEMNTALTSRQAVLPVRASKKRPKIASRCLGIAMFTSPLLHRNLVCVAISRLRFSPKQFNLGDTRSLTNPCGLNCLDHRWKFGLLPKVWGSQRSSPLYGSDALHFCDAVDKFLIAAK